MLENKNKNSSPKSTTVSILPITVRVLFVSSFNIWVHFPGKVISWSRTALLASTLSSSRQYVPLLVSPIKAAVFLTTDHLCLITNIPSTDTLRGHVFLYKLSMWCCNFKHSKNHWPNLITFVCHSRVIDLYSYLDQFCGILRISL